MTLLDRFRTSAREKSSDPLIRLAYVEELPLTERDTIASIAREDEDPRVRKAAVAKLMVPSALAGIASADRDENVRAHALSMLRDIALEAFEDVGEADGLEAVRVLDEPRALSQVAKTATRDTIALAALAKLDAPHLVGSIARHGAAEAARRQAIATLRTRGDHAELLATALNSDFKDTALAAMETITDRGEIDQIIERGRNKSAVKRARAIVRAAQEEAARQAAAAAAEALEAAAREPLVDSVVEQTTPPHGDPLMETFAPDPVLANSGEALANSGEALAPQEVATESAEAIAERERLAAEADAAARERAAQAAAERATRLTALLDQAATAPVDEPLNDARKRMGAFRREWRELTAGADVDAALLARYTDIDTAMAAREKDAHEADQRARRDGLVRLQQLLARVEPLVNKNDLTLKAAERALKDVRTALSSLPQLPTKQDYDEVSKRLKEAQTALTPKVQELRDADDWRRFANLTIQEQLCAKMEALKTLEDPEAIARQVRELQTEWRAAADVPRAQAETLWRRFKTAHDEVWARCEAHFAAQAQAREENLARKIALCEKAEALSDSTNWIQTADTIKALQAEWKTIGPVSRGKEKAVWDRFRAACDKFFTRRHDDLASRKATWTENLAKKDALCVRAEALAESTDWDAAAAELKKLQTEWKTIGPVKKSKSEAIWQRFRGASDTFFSRYAHRHDTARAERIAAREAVCTDLELLGAADTAPDDVVQQLRMLRGRWQQEIAARGVDPDHARALDDRFATALRAIAAKWPESVANTDLDPRANQQKMEAVVKRMEDLATSLSGGAADQALTPATRLATMLKEALAANTIGGKVSDDTRFRAAAEDVRQAQTMWSKIGMVPDEVRKPLADRFHRAVRQINERTGASRGPQGRR